MPNLFPEALSKTAGQAVQKAQPVNKQRKSLYFDFESGDFALDNAGQPKTADPYEEWVQWCLKTVYTERYSFLAYSKQTGVELLEAFQLMGRREQESAIIRTVTDALMADPYGRTKRVDQFSFQWEVDGVSVTFYVSGIWAQDARLETKLLKVR